MKNVLLCLLALTIALSGYSQQKPVLKGDVKSASAIKADRIGWEPVKTKPITTATVNTPANYKNTGDVNFVTVVNIGTSTNAYSYSEESHSVLIVFPVIKLIHNVTQL